MLFRTHARHQGGNYAAWVANYDWLVRSMAQPIGLGRGNLPNEDIK